MKRKPRVLFAAFEAEPFMKTGGLGDVAGSLPKALKSQGYEIRLIMPKFGAIPDKYKARMKHVCDFTLDLGWRHQYCGIETLKTQGVTCYFVDNEYYFNRDKAYGYLDDGERIAFFAKAIMDCIPHIPDFSPDIIHCNDWHTALTPVYLKSKYCPEELHGVKTIFTVHNLKFQGVYSKWCVGDLLGFSEDEAGYLGLLEGDSVNYMRGAICMSDRITTVSKTYANEICGQFFGEGLDYIFNNRRDVLSGILNGIDTKRYTPQADANLYKKFTDDYFESKRANKEAFQTEMGLEVNADKPLMVIISRLTEQKGLDLVLWILGELMSQDVQLAVLGVGDKKYEDSLSSMAGFMPDKVSVSLTFSEPLSHKFYAAADMILVPSLFEPCGLTQMIAMRYGTLPVVRETGGLKDSVIPYNKYTGEGNGFTFANYNAHELLFILKDAINLYYNEPDAWKKLVENAISTDFSWDSSAEQYSALYKELL